MYPRRVLVVPFMLLATSALGQQQPVWPPHPTKTEGIIEKIQAGDICTKIFMSDGSVWAIVPDNFNYQGRLNLANTYWTNKTRVYMISSDDPSIASFSLAAPAMVPCHGNPVSWLPNALGLYAE